MTMHFDRKIYFDAVRSSLFGGELTQQQVDGQKAILRACEIVAALGKGDDKRHFAYMLATTKHETASTMWPIEEYGHGEGMSYGEPDPETGQTYYGRGFVQLTWRDNYRRATVELKLFGDNDLEWHADRALDPLIAARTMFAGMSQGWFRTGNDGKPETLAKYFNATRHDAFNAREIINGDKNTVPSWSNGVSIGNLIAGYHDKFLDALRASVVDQPTPTPEPEPLQVRVVIHAPPNVEIKVEVIDA